MAEQTQLHSTWTGYVRGLTQSSDAFYKRVQAAVSERKIDGVKFATVEHKEGGLFSAKRVYLRVQRGDLYFDICGAPFGDGFFISSRLISEGKFLDSTLLKDGSVMKALFKPDTFYKIDTTMMYHSLVHQALMETVDTLTAADHLPPLPEADRRPVMAEFYH